MHYPIRVLHVVVNMNRGGAETLIMNVYRNLDRSKVQFDFLVHKKEGAYEKEIMDLGGKIFRIPYITDVGHYGYARTLRCFFKEHPEYKIVHTHMDCMSGLVIQAANKTGVPVRISHSHATQNEGNIIARIYKKYIGMRIIPNATHLLACSDIAARWLFGKKSVNSLIIKNGVDLNKFSYNSETHKKKRIELLINDNTLVVGHVGRFCYPKNHMFLIDVFSQIKRKYPNSLLLLVGDGPLQSDIKKKVQQVGLENSVKFLGIRSDVEELMQAMDVLLFPSHHEGLPVTIIEAQACSLKCVVSDAVPKDADIGAKLINFINLKEDIDMWVDEVIKQYKRRENIEVYLNNSGYNITHTSKKLQHLYLSANT